jgi:hypothetical protein
VTLSGNRSPVDARERVLLHEWHRTANWSISYGGDNHAEAISQLGAYRICVATVAPAGGCNAEETPRGNSASVTDRSSDGRGRITADRMPERITTQKNVYNRSGVVHIFSASAAQQMDKNVDNAQGRQIARK